MAVRKCAEWLRRRQDDERGAELVEFAVVAVLLTMLVYGIVFFGVMFTAKSTITQAASDGARAGIVASTAPEQAAVTQAQNDLGFLGVSNIAQLKLVYVLVYGAVSFRDLGLHFLVLDELHSSVCLGRVPSQFGGTNDRGERGDALLRLGFEHLSHHNGDVLRLNPSTLPAGAGLQPLLPQHVELELLARHHDDHLGGLYARTR